MNLHQVGIEPPPPPPPPVEPPSGLTYTQRQVWWFHHNYPNVSLICEYCNDSQEYRRRIKEIWSKEETVDLSDEGDADASVSSPEYDDHYDSYSWECTNCGNTVSNYDLRELLDDLDKEPY